MLMVLLQNYKVISSNIWIPIVLVLISTIIIFSAEIYHFIAKRFSSEERVPKNMLPGSRANSEDSKDPLEELIDSVGYAYNPKKDIFFSTLDAWQGKMGYCRLYDEAAAPLGMIVDSEPIRFSYGGKKWLIEFWKGQYDLTTGCEVGIYTTEWPDLNIPGFFNGTFYNCASKRDRLYMELYLSKNGEKVLSRRHKHWWLTGFKLGEFSEPSELIMDVYITFKNKNMRKVFVAALEEAGYTSDEFKAQKDIVFIRFDKPHTKQPYSRSIQTDSLIQKKNKMMCDLYQSITKDLVSLSDKIKAVKEQSPELFNEISNIGKTTSLFDTFKKIKDYIHINDNQTPQ